MFKYYLLACLCPFSICLELFLLGLILLWFSRRKYLGKVVVTLAFCLLVVFSSYPLAALVLAPLEYSYPRFSNSSDSEASKTHNIHYIVVLGGMSYSNEKIPITSQLSNTSIARLIEGIRIHRKIPGSTLILSGGRSRYDPATDADYMSQVAVALGVDAKDIITENISKNTYEEATIIKGIARDERFVLVTSAAHMPRAMALFRNLGMEPIPAPTDYRLKISFGWHLREFIPRVDGLRLTKAATYEYLALVKERLAGHI